MTLDVRIRSSSVSSNSCQCHRFQGKLSRMVRTRTGGSVLALFLFLAACGPANVPSPLQPLRHEGPVVLVTIDTLRADRVGLLGSTRGLTPRIDGLARASSGRTFVFHNAIAQVPLTLASHATILTGLHPARHGIRTNDGFRLPSEVVTLAEAFRVAGYATAAFVGGYPLNAGTGIGRGFDRFDDEFMKSGANERRAQEVVTSAVRWIRESAGNDPARARFLAWVHLFDPHTPYEAPAEFALARGKEPYDAEVAYTDTALGGLFDALASGGLFDRTLLVIVADHGESLGEHGERTHGTFVYDATVRVPMIVRIPGADTRPPGPTSIMAPVETADITPTLAALAGIQGDTLRQRVDGIDLRSLMQVAIAEAKGPAKAGRDDLEGAAKAGLYEAGGRQTVYAESYYQNVLLGWSPLRAVRGPDWKWIDAPRPELYDLLKDPGETVNRIDDRPHVAKALAARLPPAMSAELTRATAESTERLQSLGYVGGRTIGSSARGTDPKDKITVWNAIEEGVDQLARNPEGARKSLSEALRLDPENGLALKYVADLDFRAGRFAEATAGYQRALAAGFRHVDVFVNLASIAEQRGRTADAHAALVEAVKVAPHDADAWNRLGLLDAARGQLDAARRDFAQAIAAAPDRAETHYNLGLIERQAGNHAAARSHFEQALVRNPRHDKARYELATGWLAMGQPARALAEYRSALEIRPDYTEALFGAARAALELGRLEDARRDYEHFIRIAPPEYREQVAAARAALRRLERPAR
jgi:arylsulfatase A-like enzyme/tetratricopeptide (TPR) repeat protein